jgi:hypothetical protein
MLVNSSDLANNVNVKFTQELTMVTDTGIGVVVAVAVVVVVAVLIVDKHVGKEAISSANSGGTLRFISANISANSDTCCFAELSDTKTSLDETSPA